MSRIDELISEQFHRWQQRGSGEQLFEFPVMLEPAFVPFEFRKPAHSSADDGRKHTVLSGFLKEVSRRAASSQSGAEEEEFDNESEPFLCDPEELIEVALSVSESKQAPQLEAFLRQISRAGEKFAFELIGSTDEIVPRFVAPAPAASRVERAVSAFFPDVLPLSNGESLPGVWLETSGECAVIELSLGREFVVPLGKGFDLLSGIANALDGLGEEEHALFQVLFQPVVNSWAESMVSSVCDEELKPLFVNRPDLAEAVAKKTASPLFAVVARLATNANSLERAWEIVADMAAPLSALDRPGANFFVPASNDGYPDELHEWDLLNRLSRRYGMLLSLEELAPLITPPRPSSSAKLRRELKRTRAAPAALTNGTLCLGKNIHRSGSQDVFLSRDQRVRHVHVIGATGTGKSTLLLNLIRQDIERGEGLAVFDPHGDLIDSVLGFIPQERASDVVLVDPSDEEFIVGLNILTAHSDLEKSLLASDLTSVFRRLSTSWGDQMESVLRNAILAFLENPSGGTLPELRRFLIDPGFRAEFLSGVTDPEVVYFWTHAFPLLGGGKSIGPLLTRLDEFLSRKPIRYMMSAKGIDFPAIVDGGKIFLARLPQGLVGRDNAHLLGSLLVAKFQQVIMSRQRQAVSDRKDFWLYLDEFHHFITPSITEILSGARKYAAGLTLAHQELRQLKRDPEVESATLSNCQTRIVFRTSDADAQALAEGFSAFEAADIQSLEIGSAICRIERRDQDFNLSVHPVEVPQDAEENQEAAMLASREQCGTPRAEVEAELLRNLKVSAPQSRSATTPTPVEVVEPRETEQPPPLIPPPEEKSAPPPVVQEVAEAPPPKPALSLGKGSEKHKYLQEFIKRWGQDRGYLSIIEHPVSGGQVDVVLEKNGRRIACEISITTTVEHEVANVRKCLEADFPVVVLLTPNTRRVPKLEAALRDALAEDILARVKVHTPDAFFAFLEELDAADTSGTTTVRGYKVTVKRKVADAEDRKRRTQAMAKIVAEALRRKRD